MLNNNWYILNIFMYKNYSSIAYKDYVRFRLTLNAHTITLVLILLSLFTS
jgi:hypothetical protein